MSSPARPLILRRQDSEFVPAWNRDLFWMVEHAGNAVGTILLASGRSDHAARWEWTLQLHAGAHGNALPGLMAMSGSEGTREAAALAFRKSFDKAMGHIGKAGWAWHVEHMAGVVARSQRPAAAGEPGAPGGQR